MQRILQTTLVNPLDPALSFTAVVVPPSNPNVSFALTELSVLSIETARMFEPATVDELLVNLHRYIAGLLVDDAAIIDAGQEEFASALQERRIDQAFLNDVIFARNIVIEQSPPTLESLGGLVKQSPGIALGYVAGAGVAADLGLTGGLGQLVVMLTAAGGLVLFGAAKGVARAMEDGLYDALMIKLTGRAARRRTARRGARGASTAASHTENETPQSRSPRSSR
jgi:hypothetical protein